MGSYGSGDDGKSTIIASGNRVWKDALVFQAMGDLDELNSFIGLALSFCGDPKFAEVRNILLDVQRDLFKIGGMVNAFGSDFYEKIDKISEKDLVRIEKIINEKEAELEPLKQFILPGGSNASSFLHVARAVCRRAERSLVALKKEIDFPDIILRYINRLSTLLFVLARYANKLIGVEETKWKS